MAKTLGSFELQAFLAHGGMGDVYTGRHATEGYDAAIKVVPPNRSSNQALLREVRATAALNHPGIVAVYDYGRVSSLESRATDHELAAESLWFALEYANAGTLEQIEPLSSWAALRRVLLEILDALAHAHARGLIHRDLKPANILLTRRRNDAVELLLADFGIAHVRAPEGVLPETTDTFEAPAAGTPQYMAPEQVQARGRDQGAWTDLYALGCVAWELATGAPLFEGDSAVVVAMAHLSQDPGEFKPRFDVPPHFEPWLRMLLQKDFRRRYQRAAEAALALGAASPGDGGIEITPGARPTDTVPTLLDVADAPTMQLPSLALQALRLDDRNPAPTAAMRSNVPRVPVDWRPTRAPRSVGGRTGLGLFGLREIPLLGRQTERDLLWSTLRTVAEKQQTHVVLVSGGEGLGKSRLLRWFGTRVDELGVAAIAHVTHSAMQGPTAGMPLALGRRLRCTGLSRAKVYARLRESMVYMSEDSEALAASLTEVIRPAGDEDVPDGPALRFGSPTERYAAVEALLRAECQRQPTLLLVDDVQWGADAIGFVQHIIRQADKRDLPACIVLVTRPSLLAENPLSEKRLLALGDSPRVTRLDLGPLPHEDHVQLVREQVGLSPNLADQLVHVAGRDTNYSLCLVGDWVARGVLKPGPDGYEFASDDGLQFPNDITEAWGARLDRFCAMFWLPARALEALEVAAALGAEVDIDEWLAVCAARGVVSPLPLVERLIDAGFARPIEQGFSFTQSAIVAAILERSERSGRLRAVHADCARVVRRGGTSGASGAERRGLHFLAANEITEALAELAVALDARLERSAYDEAIAIADRYLDATTAPSDEAALVVRAKRADALRYLGSAAAAEVEASAILAISLAKRSTRGRAEGLRVLAGLEHGRGALARGIDRYTEAIDAYRNVGDTLGVAKCAHGRAWLALNNGQFAAAREDFVMGIELAERAGAPNEVAWSRQGFAEAAVNDGDLAAAEEAARVAIAEFEQLGSRSGHGMALTTLGNVHRERGEFAEARKMYHAALDLLTSFGSHLAGFPSLHLVALELLDGNMTALGQAVEQSTQLTFPAPFRVVFVLAGFVVAPERVEAQLVSLKALLDAPEGPPHPIVPRVLRRVEELLSARDAQRVRDLFAT